MESNYVGVGEVIEGSQEACEHWNWLENYMIPIIRSTYISAFIHGFKHGKANEKCFTPPDTDKEELLKQARLTPEEISEKEPPFPTQITINAGALKKLRIWAIEFGNNVAEAQLRKDRPDRVALHQPVSDRLPVDRGDHRRTVPRSRELPYRHPEHLWTA